MDTKLRDRLKGLAGGVSAIVGFIVLIVNFVNLYQGNTRLTTTVTLVVAMIVVWVSLLYIYRKKKVVGETYAESTLPAYPRWMHRTALIGLFAVPVAAIIGAGVWWYNQNRFPDTNKFIILVADFDGPDATYGVTETLLSGLRGATAEYDDVEIIALGQSITERKGGSTAARARGKEQGASIVLWGWYRVPRDSALVTAHFEVLLQRPKYSSLPQDQDELKNKYASAYASGELESFQVQTLLTREMSHLTLLTLGFLRYDVNDYVGAVDRFTAALNQLGPSQQILELRGIYYYRGTAYLDLENYEGAIADYTQVLEIDPSYAGAYYNRGVAYHSRGRDHGDMEDYERAIADYNRAYEIHPSIAADHNLGVTYCTRGHDYLEQEDYERAIADYDRALELTPNYAEAYSSRGIAYGRKGDYDRAIADFDRALELNPNYAINYYNRGTVYLHQENYERAIADFDRALEFNPNDAINYYNRGIAYYSRGFINDAKNDYDLAIADFDRVLELDPNHAEAYSSRGIAYAVKGDNDLAIADFDRALELNPNDAEIYRYRGNAYTQKGENDHARADFARADSIISITQIR